MKTFSRSVVLCTLLGLGISPAVMSSAAFEGTIEAVSGPPVHPEHLRYTINSDFMKVERTDGDPAQPIDVVDLKTGEVTLIQPEKKTFVRFIPGKPSSPGPPLVQRHPRATVEPPQIPGHQPGTGTRTPPPAIPVPPPPPPPPKPPMPIGPPLMALSLEGGDEQGTLLGYACTRYELHQNGETMEIWATDQLPPFQSYLTRQPTTFFPQHIVYQWSKLVAARKRFPLKAVLRTESGMERYRFEVISINPGKLSDKQIAAFKPPGEYAEKPSRPF